MNKTITRFWNSFREVFTGHSRDSSDEATTDEDVSLEDAVLSAVNLEDSDVPEEAIEVLRELDRLIEMADQHNPHYEEVLNWEIPDDPTPAEIREAWRQTEGKIRTMQRAAEQDYQHYASLAEQVEKVQEILENSEQLPDSTTTSLDSLRRSAEILSRYHMFMSWKTTARLTGFKLSSVNFDADGIELQHQVKIQFSNLLLTTTAVLETCAMEILRWKYSPPDQRTTLYTLGDMLYAREEITRDERDLIREIVDLRNHVAHNLWKRTELDWIDDFDAIFEKCTQAMGVIEYPIEDQLYEEVDEEMAKNLYEPVKNL